MRIGKAHHAAKTNTANIFGRASRLLFVLVATTMALTAPVGVSAQQPAKTNTLAASAAGSRAGEGEDRRGVAPGIGERWAPRTV